ncbi:MAG TPA: murein L,D-transpeptidase catalytic domain family protein [Longimicrobiaceae bacterium]|nr:murein L,D-transpeptidase catalytic domain family protein [Longimicrobiaceae bacterium]
MRSHPRMLAAAALSLGGLGGLLPHDSGTAGELGPTTTVPGAAVAAASPIPIPIARRVESILHRAAPTAAEIRALRVQSAVSALAGRVVERSDPNALRFAFQAYYNYRAAHPEQVRKPYLYYVDYGLDSRTPRGYVFDMDRLEVVDGPFTVAHGRGSAGEGVPTRFSNLPGSYATSLGLFLTQETYTFSGSAGGGSYRSVGLRLQGLSGPFNSAARDRRVVVHGAPYVTPERAGRSEGCPAMEEERAQELLPLISDGGLVFLFSPLDPAWLRGEPWVQGAAGKLGTRG